jgi:hypothetical protein
MDRSFAQNGMPVRKGKSFAWRLDHVEKSVQACATVRR